MRLGPRDRVTVRGSSSKRIRVSVINRVSISVRIRASVSVRVSIRVRVTLGLGFQLGLGMGMGLVVGQTECVFLRCSNCGRLRLNAHI